MAKQSFTIELDDETVRKLALLGEPIQLLAHLALSAAEGTRSSGQPKREQTDQSLRAEREKADLALALERAVLDDEADEVVRIARQRADLVVRTARQEAEPENTPQSIVTEAGAMLARNILEHERSDADALLVGERADRSTHRAVSLAVERKTTDKDLIGERAHVDTLMVEQRDANEQMFKATFRAQELAIEAAEAKERAEQGERELRAVAEFREMFIGILGHDLRNPLGAIRLGAGLLMKRGYLLEQDQKSIALIVNSTQRMARMITQLLDLTRARLGGGLLIDPKPIDLREICQSIVEEFGTAIRLALEGDLTGTWDQDRISEVLSNLLGNAVEYAAPGTVVVLKARAEEAEVVVEVCNQGEPIPADVLPFIFEPFRRGRGKSAAGNLGLGLYIAQQIALSHGGRLEAHSAGQLTIFVLRLPRSVPPREVAKAH